MAHSHPRNWIHLDLKGVIPSEGQLLDWIEWLAESGFNGIVWEYEDRLPWRSWPDVFRPGYSLESWRRIWARCAELGLETVPLVQTLGHLQWLLKRPEYSAWGEAGHSDEVCPQHPEVLPRLKSWLDEVIALHPQSTLIHIGGDEPWNFGTCPACRAKIDSLPGGKTALYLQHIGAICRHVIARGKRPMLWADFFWTEEGPGLLHQLPAETLLIDWRYWQEPKELTAGLKAAGHEVWAASALCCSFDTKLLLPPLGERLANVANWRPQIEDGRLNGVLHTVWSRHDSQQPLYGPWDGWLPGLVAGGDPRRWQRHALHDFVPEVDALMATSTLQPEEFEKLIARLQEVRDVTADERTRHCAQWWIFALEHKMLLLRAIDATFGHLGLEAVQRSVGVEPRTLQQAQETRRRLKCDLDGWERRARNWWREREWSDEEEYFASRAGNIARLLEFDWRALS